MENETKEKDREISNKVAIRELRTRIMRNATILARQTSQTIGEKNDYYITLWQLEKLLGIELR